MAHDLAKLYAQGRAKSGTELWQPEEWDAVVAIATAKNIAWPVAADFVRNGILTVEDYDKATKAKFVPTKLDDAIKSASDGLKENGKAVKAKAKK